MSLSKATRDKIKDLEYLLRGYRNRIHTTRTTLTDDAFYRRSYADHVLAITQAERAFERLIEARNNGPDIIAEAEANCQRVLAEIKALKASTKLDKLAKLRDNMAALESQEK